MPLGAIAAAAGAGSAITGAASAVGSGLLSGALSGGGAGEGSDAAIQLAREQLAWLKSIYGDAQGNLKPYMSLGSTAAGAYEKALPTLTAPYTMEQYRQSPLYTPMVTNLAELQATPGYQFQLQQGLQGVGQSAAARGGLLSGAAAKAMNDYAQNQAATGFQNAWQRAQTAYGNAFNQNLAQQAQAANIYGSASNIGQTAASNLGTIGTGVGNASNPSYQNLTSASYQNAAAPYQAANTGFGTLVGGLNQAGGGGQGGLGQSIYNLGQQAGWWGDGYIRGTGPMMSYGN